MNLRDFSRPRFIVLFLLWALPALFYIAIGLLALYQTGWLRLIAWTLPLVWLTAWLVGRAWPARKLHQAATWKPLSAPEFWTPKDAAAIGIVEEFRGEVEDVDRHTVTDPNRYLRDAETLARRLAAHYHSEKNENAFQPLTLVEILAVIHLAVEDIEVWLLENVPGSDVATIGHLNRLPGLAKAFDTVQTVAFFATAIVNPGKILAYPLWRKSGRVAIELQNELVRAFYQRYLRQIGYYLIEMYSGRLKGGSKQYRSQFGQMAAAVHASGGDTDPLAQLSDVETTIAVMGQVKAGKSSLINALMGDQVAATSILPQTREVQRFEYLLPGSTNSVILLDTPGYSEADVTRHQRLEVEQAADAADIVLLVMAANVSARQGDRQMLRELAEHYEQRSHLKPPKIIAVLTHIDLLRPVRQWSPPYDWRNPRCDKEKSIAKAVDYARELFGDLVADYACVYTGKTHAADSSVHDEVVPQLVAHLDQGHSAAILKAFYDRLSQQRFKQLSKQVMGLVRQVSRNVGP